jgi:hypothetical protein
MVSIGLTVVDAEPHCATGSQLDVVTSLLGSGHGTSCVVFLPSMMSLALPSPAHQATMVGGSGVQVRHLPELPALTMD